jgi:polysaccharide export outer membrane protein
MVLPWIQRLSILGVLLFFAVPTSILAQETRAGAGDGSNPVLQPGDLIRLKIWREPDLSGDYRVDEGGVATFPKIGPVPVGRLSTDSLRPLLVASYSRYLQNPSVEVTFLRRVNVMGEVKTPGLYDVDPTITVTDLVALAGGATPNGNPKKLELLRDGKVVSTELTLESRLLDSPLRSGDQLRIPQRGWLARNTTLVAATITGAAVIVTALIR